jgi:protein SCO1/2
MLLATKDRTDQAKSVEMSTGSGEAAVGGDFTLIDQNGHTVQDTDFRGRLMLVFFGFTHCPDICPVSVATLSQAMGKLGEKADQVAPIFITVDPERDTPQVMKEYLANFDKHMIGLTGSAAQIQQAAAAYKAYAAKHEMEESPHDEDHHHDGDHESQGDYTVDHSGFIYLMGKDGKFIRLFPYNASVDEITHAVHHALEQ